MADTQTGEPAQTESSAGGGGAPGLRHILTMWLPLAASIVMMVLEPSIINIGLGRTADAELALAAYGVAFSLALLVEAPVLMLIDASVARSSARDAFRLLERFALGIGLAVTAVGLLISLTPLYGLIVEQLMGIPPDVAERARPTLAILAFWPLPIGWRRTQQGLLIRARRTLVISLATVVRLIVLAAGMAAGLTLWPAGGAVVAGVAMDLSVIVEALVVTVATRRVLAGEAIPASGPPLGLRELWHFYWPLASTSLIQQVSRPILNAGIAAALLGVQSLAAWPVVWGLVLLIAGPAWSVQQLANALVDGQAAYRQVRQFAVGLGTLLALLVAVIALTPLYELIMSQVYNLSTALQVLAWPAAVLLIPYPLLLGIQGLLRGVLIRRGRTRAIRSAIVVNLLTLGLTIAASLLLFKPTGVVLAAVAMETAVLAEVGWLAWKMRG